MKWDKKKEPLKEKMWFCEKCPYFTQESQHAGICPMCGGKLILKEIKFKKLSEIQPTFKELVKQRVEQLLKEIEKKENEVNTELSEILDGKKKETSVNRGALYGWGEALFWVKQKIKKAFEGVI